MTQEQLPEILTVIQVADYLGVCRATVYNWTNEGRIPSFKFANTRRVRKSALLEWIAKAEQDVAL